MKLDECQFCCGTGTQFYCENFRDCPKCGGVGKSPGAIEVDVMREVRQVVAWVDAQRRTTPLRSAPLNAIENVALALDEQVRWLKPAASLFEALQFAQGSIHEHWCEEGCCDECVRASEAIANALAAAASGGDVQQAPGEAPQSGPSEAQGNAQ